MDFVHPQYQKVLGPFMDPEPSFRFLRLREAQGSSGASGGERMECTLGEERLAGHEGRTWSNFPGEL